MKKILVIKHGSLGDIAQASGAIQDISEFHKEHDIYLLTTKPYFELFKKNSHLKAVILDKRLSRFNLIYLFTLMRVIKKYKFVKVFDLQNSSRTNFYKRILFPNANNSIWSSSDTTLPENKSKNWRTETRLVRGGTQRSKFDETSEGIYMTSGYVYDSAENAEAAFKCSNSRYVYSRYANPTVTMFEDRIKALEGAEAARATASGMAVTTCCISRRDERRRGWLSSPSRAGHASMKPATQTARSATEL